jgi:murein DD-endopeptidase MepM/ murein hydrolase activator NlpD
MDMVNRFNRLKLKRWPIIITIVALVVLVGTILIWRSLAATPYVSVEAEKGTAKTPAYSVDDSNASGGSAIKFGKSTECIGNPTKPANLEGKPNELPSVALTWSVSKPAANCTISGYRLWRATGSTPPPATGTPFANNLKLPAFANTTVDYGKTYSYTVVAFDTDGHVSDPAPITVKVPENEWIWPVHKADLDSQTAAIAQCWLHYYSPKDSYHAAIDIKVTYKPVYAPHDGLVVGKYNDGYNTLIIRSGHDIRADGNGFVYAVFEHMSSISVKDGDKVTRGQRIGTSGEVGAPGAPHLHFGISDSETYFGTYANPWHTANPNDFLPKDYSPALETNGSYQCADSVLLKRADYGLQKYLTKGTFDYLK